MKNRSPLSVEASTLRAKRETKRWDAKSVRTRPCVRTRCESRFGIEDSRSGGVELRRLHLKTDIKTSQRIPGMAFCPALIMTLLIRFLRRFTCSGLLLVPVAQ